MIFTSMNQLRRYFFPKQSEKDRLSKMSPSEIAHELAKKTLLQIKKDMKNA